MISAIAGASAICCFAASYVAHQFLPVRPITISSQTSIAETINLLSKDELQKQAKTPKDFVDFYLKKQATLENVVESLTNKSDIQSAYNEIVSVSPDREDYGYFELLKKALESQYTFLKPEIQNISVSIKRSGSQISPVQSQVDLSQTTPLEGQPPNSHITTNV
jgi:hypothetical protein